MPRALITGGSRGIGAATVKILEAQGWEVLAPTREELWIQDSINVAEYARQLSYMDINAFIMNAHEWFSMTLNRQKTIDFGQQMMYVVHHWYLLRAMLTRRYLKSVVAVSSMRGLVGGVNTAPYSMAKAALIAMMQGFAKEYGGVRFNTICPGWTDTDMGVIVKNTGGVSNPNAVVQSPVFVAEQIVRVLTDTQANGQVWRVNGGVAERVAWLPEPLQ